MATRTIILIRHGQYIPAAENQKEVLTPLGRKQATWVAKRLKGYKVDRLILSSMPRAIETAQIIKKIAGIKKRAEQNSNLCECVPGFPKSMRQEYGHTNLKRLKKHRAQADRAFNLFFKASRKNQTDVIVCHGNIIRYLVCKVMGVDTSKWISLDILQCGISVIEIRSKGKNRRVLISHNDTGHIPIKQQTFL